MQKYYGWWLPIDISTHGAEIDKLIIVIHVFMAVLFVGWLSFFVYVLFRFRAQPGQKAHYHTKHFKLPTYVEIVVAITEVILLVAFTFPIWHHVRNDFPPADKAFNVHVIAEQFAWNIHYPGKDGIFGRRDIKLVSPSNPIGLDNEDVAAKDDLVSINQLHIPINEPVVADLSSKDVIHSFSLPVMRVKQDVIPGQKIKVWFQAKETGDFEIACAQLCGLGHYRMRGFFSVETREKFDAWFNEQIAQK